MLDPVSILLITILSALMSMAVLGSLLPTGMPGVRYWFVASALSIVALTLFVFQKQGPPLLTVLAANAVLAVAVLMILQGSRQFLGRRPVVWAEYAACALLLASIAYWTYLSPNIAARVVVVSGFHAYVYAAIGWMVHAARPTGRPAYAYRFVSIAAFLGAFGHAARAAVYGLGWEQQAALLQSTPINIAFLGVGILALPCMSIGMVMMAHDLLAQRLERLANLDELTGIHVRRAFLAHAEAALRTARRTGRPLSLAVLDIDHFKRINDGYGHAAGDKVLAHFCAVVAHHLRAGDGFGRLGGEEFAILCPDTGKEDAAALMNRLRLTVAMSGCQFKNAQLSVTFSAGVDEYRPGDTLASLMGRADAALYAAKAMGRNRVVVAAPADEENAAVEAG